MANYKIGIQLTKNKAKYEYLLNLLNSNLNVKKGLEFVYISDDLDLKNKISQLDILTTYGISENLFLHASDQLKWIHFGAAGIDQSLFPSILKSRTIITNASGIHSGPVSEFAIGMILYLSKQFRGCENFKNNAEWTQWELARQTIQLNGKTVGIIGFGKIAKAIAKKAKAFDMKVIATRRLQKKVENKKIVDELIPLTDLDYLLRKSDYVVIACPLTPLTDGMIGNKELAKMRSSAFIINIARGPIIDEKALIEVLKNQKIMGAGLDVFSIEPLDKESPLFGLDNVFLSPHISGNFPEYQEDVVLQFSDNLNRYLSGQNLKNRVCKKRLY
jgi:phosphoglycerate dehydrogenase-like enzyme